MRPSPTTAPKTHESPTRPPAATPCRRARRNGDHATSSARHRPEPRNPELGSASRHSVSPRPAIRHTNVTRASLRNLARRMLHPTETKLSRWRLPATAERAETHLAGSLSSRHVRQALGSRLRAGARCSFNPAGAAVLRGARAALPLRAEVFPNRLRLRHSLLRPHRSLHCCRRSCLRSFPLGRPPPSRAIPR